MVGKDSSARRECAQNNKHYVLILLVWRHHTVQKTSHYNLSQNNAFNTLFSGSVFPGRSCVYESIEFC